ncbi:cobalamin-dependent protein [Candidatus Bathyarchaeota archaeon]|nr:cobalamin-dependent protein [Candidatus Bathyarchaeota archaeon]
MRVLFIEPPKDEWFVMGEYLPPPFGIIQLAAFLEKHNPTIEIEVLDCNAEQIDWIGLERHVQTTSPDIVASSSLATCNTYTVVRTLETAKKVNPKILTITGGQHFTATAEESLRMYPEIDVIVRGEGEETLTELANTTSTSGLSKVDGISYRNRGRIIHNPSRRLIENLDELPYPGYHFVKNVVGKYHFAAMVGKKKPYAIIEGSRGCPYECTFCTQWRHWQCKWRLKTAKRVADEFQFVYDNFGSRFIWLTDDNFGVGPRAIDLADEIVKRKVPDDLTWFVQSRCDDIVNNRKALPRLRKSGLTWVLLGVENDEPSTLQNFKKGITPQNSREAVRLLKENDIFAHAMFIIGERKDTHKSIARLRAFANSLDPDFAIFSVLTPFPGTQVYDEAKKNGWIKDFNWAHYDMVHAIMPTETLSTREVQEELYKCYRSFYGSWSRRFRGFLSANELKRRIFLYMARRGIIAQLKNLV